MLDTFISYFILPFIFIALGFILPQYKTIGPVGYRTPRSMKNQTNWDLAQKLSGTAILLLGGILLVNSLLFYFSIVPSSNFKPVEGTTLGIGVLLVIIWVEYRLYRFDKRN
ncbi:SdpI family protein [Myroides odoratus]|uniref:SdpI family protein n=1 Tax=Myroides odoratus TaxID=256 RepID=UPI0039B04729